MCDDDWPLSDALYAWRARCVDLGYYLSGSDEYWEAVDRHSRIELGWPTPEEIALRRAL